MQTFNMAQSENKRKLNIDKRLLKAVIKIVSFLLTLLIVFYSLSVTVFSKGAAASYNNRYANAYAFLQEPENTIEIAGVGNSNFYSAFVPIQLWEQYGYTSTLACAPSQSPAQSYELLEKIFEKQSPKLVIIETDMLYKKNPQRDKSVVEEETKPNPLDPFFEAAEPENFDDMISGTFTIFTFHDKWKTILRNQSATARDVHSHGYHLSVKTKRFKMGDYMEKSDETDMPRQKETEALKKLISLSVRHGAKVLLVSAPCPTSWSGERHNAVEALAKENGVSYYDLNLYLDDMKLSRKKDFRDGGTHLNYYGAKKVTKQLGGYLKAEFNIDDLSGNPSYDFWNESAGFFYEDVEKAEREQSRKNK